MDLVIDKTTNNEGYIHYKDWGYPVEVVNGELKSISCFWDKVFAERLCFEIPELTQDELAEYCKGICQAEEFLLNHLKARFATMKEGEGQMFSILSYWGLEFPNNDEFNAEEIGKLLGYQFDYEKDIVFLFNWFGSDALEGKIVYSVPERIVKKRRDKKWGKLPPMKVTSTHVKSEVKVWQPGDEEPTFYSDVEEVTWNFVKGVVVMKKNGETIKVPADKVTMKDNITH